MPESPCETCGEINELVNGLCSRCALAVAATMAPEAGDDTSADSSAVAGQVPEGFGDYEILEEIARGGMGVVYKARHTKLDRVAAVKMILSGRFSSDEELQRFNIEARAAAALDHPGIVPVYEIGEADGQAFFAMKFIEGGSLASKIEEFQSNPRDAIALLAKVAHAVHHAHQRGVLHRDLKPANVLIDEHGDPLITDLGLAKQSAQDSGLTNTGAILGTPSYMPPEQARSGETVTTSADVYALGAIMYELLSGRPPYRGNTAIETVMQVLEGPAEPLRKHAPDVDRDLELICMKCLERVPDARYGTARELADDLTAWLADEPISVKAPSPITRARQWVRRNKRTTYAVLGLLLATFTTVPFALDVATGDQFSTIYDRFPDGQRPMLYSFGSTPRAIGLTSAVFLVLGVWPLSGWFTSVVARPKSVRGAAGTGLLLVAGLTVFFVFTMGWLVVSRGAASASSYQIRTLAEAVWAEPAEEEEAKKAADQMFVGLEAIPESERPDIVARRIRSDQVASGPIALGNLLLAICFAGLPIVIGTVYSFMMLERGGNRLFAFVRYLLAWGPTTFSLLPWTQVVFQQDGLAEATGVSVVAAVISWLVLRRWSRKNPVVDGAG